MRLASILAWRYLSGRPLRTVLTTLAVVFGVAVLFGMNSMLPTITKTFTQSMLSTAGQVDLTVTNKSGSSFEADVVDELERVDGIAGVSPAIRRNVAMPRGFDVSSLTVVGIDPDSASDVRSFPEERGRMVARTDSGVVALGVGLADRLDLDVGDSLRIPGVNGMETFEVVGVLNTVAAPGAEEVFMNLPDAQALLGESNRVSEIEAAFERGVDREAVESSVRRAVGDDYAVGGLAAGSEILASLKIGEFMMNMFGVFALAMGGFIILNTFRTVVAERRHDIGMLRAVGASRRTILSIFIVESLFQGILGTAAGLVAGYGLAWGIIAAVEPIYAEILNMDMGSPILSVNSLVISVVLGIGMTMAGALSPAIAASRITPLEALRPQVGEVERKQRGRRAWVGVAILVISGALLITQQASLVGLAAVGVLVGLILVAPELVSPVSNAFARVLDFLFPTEGEIARSNMQRQPSRAATTASAVMISLSIIIALLGVMASVFSGFMTYVDKSVAGADYVLLPSNFLLGQGTVGASNEFVEELRGVPGMQDVATLRIAKGEVNDASVQVIGIDPVDYPKVASFEFSADGSVRDIEKLGNGRTLIANGVYAAQNGITTGQTLELQTVNGLKRYKVAAIGSDYLNAKLATIYISQDRLSEDFGTEANVAVLANARPGADTPLLEQHLERLTADYPQMTLYETATFRELQEQTFAQSMVMMYVLVAVLAIPSLLALLNNLAMSVIARTREIGMLRAVGAKRKQVRRMVLAESLLLASVGVAFGVISGIVLGYAMVEAMNQVGFKMPYFFPTGGIVAGVAIGFAFALIAALIPARAAARLDIVTALHYE